MPYFDAVLRIALIPAVVIVLFYSDYGQCPADRGNYCLPSRRVTDFLDGWVARKYGQGVGIWRISRPVADKLMVTSIVLVMLVQGDP